MAVLGLFSTTCSHVDFFRVDRPSLRTYLDSPLSPRTTEHHIVLYFSFNAPTLRVYDGSCYHLCPRLKMVSTFQVKRRRLKCGLMPPCSLSLFADLAWAPICKALRSQIGKNKCLFPRLFRGRSGRSRKEQQEARKSPSSSSHCLDVL